MKATKIELYSDISLIPSSLGEGGEPAAKSRMTGNDDDEWKTF